MNTRCGTLELARPRPPPSRRDRPRRRARPSSRLDRSARESERPSGGVRRDRWMPGAGQL